MTAWTPEMDRALADLRARGVPSVQIAACLNKQFSRDLTKSAILGRAHRLKLDTANPKGPTAPQARREDELWLAFMAAPKTAPSWRLAHLCRIAAEDIAKSGEPPVVVAMWYAPVFAATGALGTP